MILWLTGNTGSGKTTLARKLARKNTINLDGDQLRNIWTDLTLSKEDREEHCFRVARLASRLEDQGYTIIISVICPYESLRRAIKTEIDCVFIYVKGGKEGEDYPYEIPEDPDMIYDRDEKTDKYHTDDL